MSIFSEGDEDSSSSSPYAISWVAETKWAGRDPASRTAAKRAFWLDKFIILYYNTLLALRLGAWGFSQLDSPVSY